MPAGRPSKYTPEIAESILELMNQGLSLAASAAANDICRDTVYAWEKEIPEFSDIIRLARGKRQLFLERRLLSATEGPVVTSSIFALKNAAGQDWREKQEHEVSGPNRGPVQSEVIVTVVDPQKREA